MAWIFKMGYDFKSHEIAGWKAFERNQNIYLVAPHFLLNRNLFMNFCSLLKGKIEELFEKNKSVSLNFRFDPIYIVTSFGIYSEQYDEFYKESRLVKMHPHLAFILGSSLFIKTINIPRLINDPRKYVKSAIESYEMDYSTLLNNIRLFRNNIYEYIFLNLNIQTINKLPPTDETSGSHGKHVTPFLYSNEQFSKDKTQIENNYDSFLKSIRENQHHKEERVNLRILLVDDKLSKNHFNNGNKEACKAQYIKFLLQLEFDKELRDRVCWLTQDTDVSAVHLVYFTSPIKEKEKKKATAYFHDSDSSEMAKIIWELKTKIENTETDGAVTLNRNIIESDNISVIIQAIKLHSHLGNCIQIVAVNTIKDARTLLASSEIRFDLMLVDYLLHTKENDPLTREYGTRFWMERKEQNDHDYEKLFELEPQSSFYDEYRQIKENRGPLKKLWIFPITAFNQTFIDDLRNKGVRLIDYYWYLSRGADPINTPYNFIYSLNSFLQLQLKEAIFCGDDIKKFLEKSLIGAVGIKENYGFIAYMGAEYTVFVEKYCKRPVIYRDMMAGSLFAKYIWKNFYSNKTFRHLFRFVHYMQKFYHKCAFGSTLDAPQMLIYWNDLNIFLDENPGLAPDADLNLFRDRIKQLFQ